MYSMIRQHTYLQNLTFLSNIKYKLILNKNVLLNTHLGDTYKMYIRSIQSIHILYLNV